MNNVNIFDVVKYFVEIFDIPPYYRYQTNIKQLPNLKSRLISVFDLYAYIGDINIYITENIPPSSLNYKEFTINTRLFICNDEYEFELLFPIDDFQLLIVDDIIKTFQGVIYEKKSLCCP